ncbi:MAG: peptidoglycan DD-metalloendopeptidase family protein [Acidobacteriota bacterium]|nr:peptidoglycan DD-metalloendopeptidase family protein [Acidobacteriota bacterium]
MARTVKLNLVLAALILTAAASAAVGYLFGLRHQPSPTTANINSNASAPSPSVIPEIAEIVSPTPDPQPIVEQTPTPSTAVSPTSPSPSNEAAFPPASSGNTLMIPVIGIRKTDLQDTFTAARSGGRAHDAIDIIAARGTPIVATADGEIVRFFDSERGGITIYQHSADKRLMYYYAHLDRRADNIQPKQFVRQGTVIGYVGDTGNSGAGNYHLHFAIWKIDDPKRDWDGTNINPYPLLKDGIEASVNN